MRGVVAGGESDDIRRMDSVVEQRSRAAPWRCGLCFRGHRAGSTLASPMCDDAGEGGGRQRSARAHGGAREDQSTSRAAEGSTIVLPPGRTSAAQIVAVPPQCGHVGFHGGSGGGGRQRVRL